MFERNVSWLFASYRLAAFDEGYDLRSVLGEGDTLMVLKGGGGRVDLETGIFTPKSPVGLSNGWSSRSSLRK